MSLMKRYKTPKAGLFLVLLLVLGSCLPDDTDPEDLYGQWEITEIQAVLDERNAPRLIKEKVYGTENLYFEFLSGGRFATNTDIGLNKFLLEKRVVTSGIYDFTSQGNRDYIELRFNDPQFNTQIELTFEVIDLDTNSPKMRMDTNAFISSIRASINRLPNDLQNSFYEFTTRITEAEFILSFSKD